MPIHDWTRVAAGQYHGFHQQWITYLCQVLNSGVLPEGFAALPERKIVGFTPDLLAVDARQHHRPPNAGSPGVAVAVQPPRAQFVIESGEQQNYARRADRVAIRVDQGELVAVIEIVSPGNKDTEDSVRTFVTKARRFLRKGVHLLVVDPFPPGPRDPNGLHACIWERIDLGEFRLPPEKPLTMSSYRAGSKIVAYVDPVASGDPLPSLPLFLTPANYVPCPLEESYEMTWRYYPAFYKQQLA